MTSYMPLNIEKTVKHLSRLKTETLNSQICPNEFKAQ